MAINKDITSLEKIGFSENEALTYLALVDLKISTADPIISKTSLHRSVVYTSLDHLIARKLVDVREVKGKKTFSVSTPSILIEEFEQKRALAEEMTKIISAKLKSETQEITIHQGNEEYLSLLTGLLKLLPKGGTKYVLGTGGEAFMRETMLPIWKKYHKVAREKDIKIRMIGYEPQKQFIDPYTSKEGIYEVKYLSSGSENPSGVHIYPEAGVVLNIIYSDEFTPVTAIKIKNKALVKGYLNLFNNLWEQHARV